MRFALTGKEADRKWWLFAAMTGALSMIMLDMTMVGVILPTVQRDLNLSTTALQWVANAYLLAFAALLPLGGRLADMLDGVRLAAAGMILFAASSAVAGVVESAGWLIAARAVQGVGAALMIPASLTVVVEAFAEGERGRAVGLRAGISSVFLSLGPLVAGLATESVSWRLIFWVNVPVCTATLVAAWVGASGRAPTDRDPGAKLDRAGVLTLIPGLAAVVLAIMEGSVWGWGSTTTIALLALGCGLLTAFAVVEMRAAVPLVDLRLFRNRFFAADAIVVFLIEFGLLGLTVFGAILLQDLVDLSPSQAGLAILPTTVAVIVVSPVAGRLYDRIGARLPMVLGLAFMVLGLIWIGLVLGRLSYPWLAPGYLAEGVGIGLTLGPADIDAVEATPPAERGQAAGLMGLMRQTGGAFGVAVMGTLITGVQQLHLGDYLDKTGLTPDRVPGLERILAEDPGSQRDIAANVPHADLGAVLAVARDAIVQGIAVAYYASAGVLVAAIVAVIVVHRRGRRRAPTVVEVAPS
jgi:EmrB/QacA subfamily drug resistance transporter